MYQHRPLSVADRYRTNELSLIEGGFTVTVYYKDNRILVYDKIKNPKAYVAKLPEKEIDRYEISPYAKS